MDDEEKLTFTSVMYRLGLTVLSFFLACIASLLQAWCMSKVYGWFVAPDLGPGPSLAGWYGVSTLTTLLLVSPMAKLKRKKETGKASDIFVLIFAVTLGSLIITLGAYLGGRVLGWI